MGYTVFLCGGVFGIWLGCFPGDSLVHIEGEEKKKNAGLSVDLGMSRYLLENVGGRGQRGGGLG